MSNSGEQKKGSIDGKIMDEIQMTKFLTTLEHDKLCDNDAEKYAHVFIENHINLSVLKKYPTKEKLTSDMKLIKIPIGISRRIEYELFEKTGLSQSEFQSTTIPMNMCGGFDWSSHGGFGHDGSTTTK